MLTIVLITILFFIALRILRVLIYNSFILINSYKSRKAYLGIEGPTVEKFGGKVELVEDVEGISTSEIIGKILRMRDEKKS